MIETIHFKNFKALRDTKLRLSRFNLLVGPNGSGKSTVMQALQKLPSQNLNDYSRFASAGIKLGTDVQVIVRWTNVFQGATTIARWKPNEHLAPSHEGVQDRATIEAINRFMIGIRVYNLDATAIAHTVGLKPDIELATNGAQLAAVLDRLRDREPERFESVNQELGRWIPEFDRILFDTPLENKRAFLLRMRKGLHRIPAPEISQGTLLALTMLALAYLPEPPPLVCFEEPDRGIHPRLLRDVRDALYRLSYPEEFGETRKPIQVIATTHSPYLLDLFRDKPEEIVIANKLGDNVKFERLSERKDLHSILEDSHLGDAWYTGVLGGVPAGT
ncbi:MAG: AAA family ATPase [Phycisphaerales bacterium]|nr:AAA family ATPase [Phycisphaerales bacterium]